MSQPVAEDLNTPGMTAAPARASARLRLGVAVLLTANGFSSLLGTALTPVLSSVAAHFGGGTGGALTAQNIVTISAFGIMFGGPAVGWLARRISVRMTLVLALAIYAVAGSSGMYLDSAPALLGARFIQGIGTAGITITTAALVAQLFEGADRARFLGYRDAFLAAFGFFALNGSGMVADAAGWRASFALYLLALPMLGLVLMAHFPERKFEPPPAANILKPPSSVLALWPIYLMVIALYLAAYTLYLNLSFVLAADNVTSASIQGRILATSTVMHFFGSMAYGWVFARVGARWVFAFTLLGMALSNFTIGFSQGTAWIVAGTGMAGLAGGYLQVYLTNLLLARAPADIRPQALGFMITAMYAGQFLNPFVATPLRHAIGNHEAFLAVGAALTLGAIVHLFISRPSK